MENDDYNQQAELAENEAVQHQDHGHKDPGMQTPNNLQHGNTYRPEGAKE